MAKLITVCLIVVGLINFVPVAGVLSAQKMEAAYSVSLQTTELQILMRHRALLFGILGGFVLYAAFVPAYQNVAMVMAGISMVGFAVLVVAAGDYNPEIRKVLLVDMVGIVFLIIAAVLKVMAAKHVT